MVASWQPSPAAESSLLPLALRHARIMWHKLFGLSLALMQQQLPDPEPEIHQLGKYPDNVFMLRSKEENAQNPAPHRLFLTDLQNILDAALLEQLDAAVKGRVVVLLAVGGHPGQGAVHADVALVPGKRPEDHPLLDGLGDAVVALLDALERHRLGRDPSANVQEA